MPRLTSHGEVCYHSHSNGLTHHPFWGDAAQYWPGPEVTPTVRIPGGCGTCGGQPAPLAAPPFGTVEAWFADAQTRPCDFHEHVKTLKELADNCDTVAEISLWDDKPATVALAASKASKVISVRAIAKRIWGPMQKLRPDFIAANDDGPVRDGVDLLFLDENHRAQELYDGLVKYAPHVRRYLVIHCTTSPYGETGDDGGPGVMPGVRRFLQEHSEWVVKRFDEGNHGLIVLSQCEEDKVPVSFGVKDVYRYGKAKLKHRLNGGKYLTLPMAQERIDKCTVCEKRGGAEGGNCTVCKCFLFQVPTDATVNAGQPGKVFFPLEMCPVGKWHTKPTEGNAMTSEEVESMLATAFGDHGE
jgi:hypothetical protein